MSTDDLGYRVWMRSLRALARALLGTAYRLEVHGISNVPREGGALVVANHTSFHDWLFMGAALPRPPRFVMHQHHFQYPALRAFFEASRVIPIAPRKQDPARLDEALDEIDRALERGELVVLCPEGTMTPDGSLGEIRPGVERIVARRAVPVVPLAIEGLFGSTFSRAHGPPMSKWSRRFRARVVVRVGAPIPAREVTTSTLRERLLALLAPGAPAPSPPGRSLDDRA
ncbi:MAG: 1-acyl-sn-glycerol-3-phosphate acyltransferase [Myxococcota bacterium]|nr:1-acyl-sn-glycerol-3-phosphate acyltransferase [Myxococcota bacterium]